MQKSLLYRTWLIIAVIVISALLALPLDKKINLGLDLQGGMYLILKVDTSNLPEKQKADAVDRALEIIRNRIDEFGVKEPIVADAGQDHGVRRTRKIMTGHIVRRILPHEVELSTVSRPRPP